MNTKLMTSIGCLLLAAAAIAPTVVVGHSERDPITGDASGYPGGVDTSLICPDLAEPNCGVSGRYVGGAGPAVAIEAYTNPQDTLATGGMLCDAEVVVDSNTAPDNVANEKLVDGVVHSEAANGGGLEDFWDDGGQGGACHTSHYTTGGFNTLGCYSGLQASAGAHSGADVWIGASCDWKEDQGGTSSEASLILCLTNALLAFNPFAILGPNPPLTTPDLVAFAVEIQAFIDCVFAYRDCLLDPTCGPTDPTEICNPDGFSDAINYGYGSGNDAAANFPTNTGIYYVEPPGTPDPRADDCADGPAAVFVWDTVATNGGIPEVYPAFTGEIWS